MNTFNALHFRAFIAGHIEAMLFAETATDSNGEEIDNLAGYELSATAKEESEQACARFLDWHGVGFWDRGLGSVGDDLSDAARSFGEKHVFIDDDGLIGVE